MKHYRLNQIAMAVLGALLLFFGARTIVNIAYEEHEPEKPGLEVAGTEEKPEGGEAKPGETAGGSEILALLATADPKQGEADAALCKVCHSFEKGGPAIIGPDLYDVIGRKIASVEGFNYTPALKAHEGEWTYENLDPWLKSPQAFAPGTMMAFPGVPDNKKRANIIVFLRSKSDNPKPLPEAPAPKEAPAAAPAEPAPSAETPAPPTETPAPPAETPAPAAETPAPPAETPAPPAETPAPAAETPAAPAPEAAAPEEAPAASSDQAEPSAGEPPSPSQPQPVYPEGKPEGVE